MQISLHGQALWPGLSHSPPGDAVSRSALRRYHDCGPAVVALVLLRNIGNRGARLAKANSCQPVGIHACRDEVLFHGLRPPQGQGAVSIDAAIRVSMAFDGDVAGRTGPQRSGEILEHREYGRIEMRACVIKVDQDVAAGGTEAVALR